MKQGESKYLGLALGMGIVFAGAACWQAIAAPAEEPSTIAKVMQALHKGPQAVLGQLKAKLGNESPDWSAVEPLAKKYQEEVSKLPGQEPPKGEAASYEQKVKAYLATAKTLTEASTKKDLNAAKEAMGKIGMSCKDCHAAHKP